MAMKTALNAWRAHLEWLVRKPEKRGKIPALTETGGYYHAFGYDPGYSPTTAACIDHNEGNPAEFGPGYWSGVTPIFSDSRADHFYVRYPGHPATGDFIKFVSHPMIWLEKLICLISINDRAEERAVRGQCARKHSDRYRPL